MIGKARDDEPPQWRCVTPAPEFERLAIMNALAESIADASDDDVLAEAREAGENPAEIAARVRALLQRGAWRPVGKPFQEDDRTDDGEEAIP